MKHCEQQLKTMEKYRNTHLKMLIIYIFIAKYAIYIYIERIQDCGLEAKLPVKRSLNMEFPYGGNEWTFYFQSPTVTNNTDVSWLANQNRVKFAYKYILYIYIN